MRNIHRAGTIALALSTALIAESAVATTLSYGSYVSRSHTLHTDAVQPFFEAIEQDTDSSLRFRLHTDGTVVGARNSLSAITDGVVDMGLVIDVYVPAEVSASALISELALFPANTLAGSAAMNEMTLLHCEQCIEEWEAAYVQPMGFYSTDPYKLMCRSSVKDISSLNGKRVRAASAWAGWAAAMGAVPVGISTGEMYEALSRGGADCALGSTVWLNSYGLSDVITHVLDMEIGSYRGGHFMNMNIGKWKSLTDEQRTAVRSHLPLAVARAAIAYDSDSGAALEAAQEEEGIQLIEAGQDIHDRYAELLELEVERVVALGAERGVRDPRALVEKFLSLLEKWEGIVADLDGSEEAFAAALDSHIYQKANF